jgi:signal peptidase II
LLFGSGLAFFSIFGLALFCGGSLSNLLDRVTFGGVVDFINFGLGELRPYIFNLADIAIGTGLMVFSFSMVYKIGKSAVGRLTGAIRP